MPKQFIIKEFPSVAAVAHAMVLQAPSGLNAQTIADTVGYKRYQTMMSELSRQPGHKLGADMLLPLMDASNSDAPLIFLARQRNGVFIKLEQIEEGKSKLMEGLATSIKEFGEFAAESASAIADGTVTRAELDRITVEGHEAIEAILQMMKMVRAKYENPEE